TRVAHRGAFERAGYSHRVGACARNRAGGGGTTACRESVVGGGLCAEHRRGIRQVYRQRLLCLCPTISTDARGRNTPDYQRERLAGNGASRRPAGPGRTTQLAPQTV